MNLYNQVNVNTPMCMQLPGNKWATYRQKGPEHKNELKLTPKNCLAKL